MFSGICFSKLFLKSQKKHFYKMYTYNNVGMANREKQPRQERDDIRTLPSLHPFTFVMLMLVGDSMYYVWELEAEMEGTGVVAG